jgi:hypothetical protein
MMGVQKISESTTLSDEASVALALEKLKAVPEHELHFFLVQRDTLNATTPKTRQAITLAQMEYDRRVQAQTESLAYRTTILSSVLGIAGVIVGVLLGVCLKSGV